jgi:hypothetical protein
MGTEKVFPPGSAAWAVTSPDVRGSPLNLVEPERVKRSSTWRCDEAQAVTTINNRNGNEYLIVFITFYSRFKIQDNYPKSKSQDPKKVMNVIANR